MDLEKTTLLRWIMLQRLMQGARSFPLTRKEKTIRFVKQWEGKFVPAGMPERS